MRNQSVCVCMYVCRCLTNLHLPPEDPTSCHEETPNSRTQCCSEDFCNTHQNYKGPIPGESCLPPPPPPAPPPRPHTCPSHAHSCLIHRHICERNILTTSHLRSRAPPFVRQLNHAHVIAPHHLRFLDRILWHTRITHTHLFTTSPSHTHSHTSLSCCTPSTVPLRLTPCPLPPALPHALATCASCAFVSWDSSYTHTHTRCTRTPVFVVVVYPHLVCVYTHDHPPWPPRPCSALAVSADLSHHSH